MSIVKIINLFRNKLIELYMNFNIFLKKKSFNIEEHNKNLLSIVSEFSMINYYYNKLIIKYSKLYDININLKKENEYLKKEIMKNNFNI